MGLSRWLRTHRALAAFAAGVLLTLAALAAVGYLVLSDQRRSARVLGLALSRALAREVRIERVTDLGTDRVVMRGVRLPRAGGWPADLAVERVEATGPLLAAVRGEPAPLRLTVTRPTVDLAAEGAGAGLALLDGAREAVAGFLAGSPLLDVTLTGGVARGPGGEVAFDLVLSKGRGEARAEVTLRAAWGAPLVLTMDGRLDRETARLALVGRGGLAPLSAWLPDGGATSRGEGALDLRLDAELGPSAPAHARGHLALGDVVVAEGEATHGDGALRIVLSRAAADLAFVARAVGLGWEPSGRAELADVTATWRRGGGALPTVGAQVRVSPLALPAAALGVDVTAERLEGRLDLRPGAPGAVVEGAARAARLRAGELQIAPVQSRYRVSFDTGGGVARADLEDLVARVEGAALQGALGYDGGGRRIDARLGGEEVEAAGLVRRLAPGWLGPTDRLRLAGLRLTATGLDGRALGSGRATLEARALVLRRPDGELVAGRIALRADLARDAVALALEGQGIVGDLAAFRGAVPALAGSAELTRRSDGGLQPARGALTARDGEGRELLVARLGPGPGAGRLALSARLPDLSRLDGWWPDVARELNGSASLDVELAGPGLQGADGRLALTVPAAELLGGTVSLRDLAAELPVRRGSEHPGAPPWGTIAIAELIAYGVVVRDLTTPARMWNGRLNLNDLAYALYSGEGRGWAELELEPAGPFLRGQLLGERVRIEEFVSAYGIRGGTMTGLLQYDVDFQYRAGRLGVNGRFEVPRGGTVNIELLNRLLAYAEPDPTGVLRAALGNLRAFDYKSAEADVRSAGDDIRVSLALRGREQFGIFPPKVREINIRNMPLGFLARQFPGS